MIIQGPLLHVANPLYKTPRRVSRNNSDYDVVDLEVVDASYLPRTNYGPAVDIAEYRRRMTKCRWDPSKSHGDFFRLAIRRMINLNSERSLVSAVIPPRVLHVHGVESVAFGNALEVLAAAAIYASLPLDFVVKAAGIGNLHSSDFARFPTTNVPAEAVLRQLKLNALTETYSSLWSEVVGSPQQIIWSAEHACLKQNGNDILLPAWNRESALRAEYPRRLALIETNVLVSKAFGLSLEQLLEMYRIYFPVLQENEAGTWYDQNGRIVWTCSKGLPGVGYLNEGKSPGRKEWESILATNPSELVCAAIDDTRPGGPYEVERRFVGPFFTCDRAEDYKRAWAHFEKLDSASAI